MEYYPSPGARPLERRGLAILYSYTPFKVIYAKELKGEVASYTMVLITPAGYHGYYYIDYLKERDKSLRDIVLSGKNSVDSLWREHASVTRFVDDYNVYIYERFPSFVFTKTKSPYVVIAGKSLRNYFSGKISKEDLEKDLNRLILRRRFLLAEFSYESFNSPKICRKGIVLLSHREECPLLGLKLSMCKVSDGRCPYYVSNTRETYAGLFKVYPLVKVVITGYQPKQSTFALFSLHYRGYPLATVHFNDDLTLIAYYRGIVLKSKTPYTKYDYLYVPMNKYRTIGIRIRKTQGLTLTFDSKTIEKLSKELIDNKWVKFKLNLLARAGITLDNILAGVTIKHSYKAWREFENLVSSILKKKYEFLNSLLDQGTDKGMGEFLVIHTLAHLMVESLRESLGLPDEALMYIIEREIKESHASQGPQRSQLEIPLWKIYLFETASGGYGFIRSLVKDRKRLYDILVNSIRFFGKPSHEIETYCKGLPAVARAVREEKKKWLLAEVARVCQNVSGRWSSVCKQLEEFVSNLFKILDDHELTFHPYALRHVLVNLIPGGLEEQFREIVEKLLVTFGPFDGNVGCCYIEEGCFLGPFLEPFTTSFSVLEHVATNYDSFEGKIRDVVLAWLGKASQEIMIMTSNMSKETRVFEKLAWLCRDRGVTVRVLLGKNAVNDPITCKAVKELGNSLKDKLSVRLHRLLHDKAIIVDDVAVITGTFNFTAQGLNVNIENLEIITEPSRVLEYVTRFNKLWNDGEEYGIKC